VQQPVIQSGIDAMSHFEAKGFTVLILATAVDRGIEFRRGQRDIGCAGEM